MGLSQNIALLRKNIGLTQEKLAEKCGVSRQAVTKWESGESEPSIEKLVILSEIFGISIDELIKNENVNDFNNINKEVLDYSILKLCINKLYESEMFDAQNGGGIKYKMLYFLIMLVRNLYIDSMGSVRDKYLLCNTNQKDRSACLYPFNCCQDESFEHQMLDEYVLGKCEINVFFDKLLAEYERRSDNSHAVFNLKIETSIINNLFAILGAASINDLDMYNEMWIEKRMEKIHEILSEKKDDTLVERLLLFFANEVEVAIKNRNEELLNELRTDLRMLGDYVWYKTPTEETN